MVEDIVIGGKIYSTPDLPSRLLNAEPSVEIQFALAFIMTFIAWYGIIWPSQYYWMDWMKARPKVMKMIIERVQT